MNEQQEFENYCKETGTGFLKVILIFALVAIGAFLLYAKYIESSSENRVIKKNAIEVDSVYKSPAEKYPGRTMDENVEE